MAEDQKDSHGLDIQESISRAELFVNKNKKSLSIILGTIVVAVGGFLFYKYSYLANKEKEASAASYKAEEYFQSDSLAKALNGDGSNLGFEEIADDYGMTKQGNLAHFYAGMALLKSGKFEEAIEKLKGYDAPDEITGALTYGAIGDAYMELKNNDEAVSYYEKAVKENSNTYTTPLMLMKLGGALEAKGNGKEAAEVYHRIKKDYPQSTEAQNSEKYAFRAEAMAK